MTESTDSKPPRRRRRILFWGLLIPALLIGYVLFRVGSFLLIPPPALEVGPETTVIDGQISPDGTIDYRAALNERMSEGVTPENNAAVLLIQAFGPDDVPETHREFLYRELEISPLPTDGPYLKTFDKSLDEHEVAELRQGELREAMPEVPFSREEYPELANWIEDSSAGLNLLTEATKRPFFYWPLIDGGAEPDPLVGIGISIQQHREAARLFKYRALLRLHENDLDGACADALACHQLAWMALQNPFLIDALVGYAVDAIAVSLGEQIIQTDSLTLKQRQDFRRQLHAQPPLRPMSQILNQGERFFSLDLVQKVGSPQCMVKGEIRGLPTGWLDVNVLTRQINEVFDQAVLALREEEFVKRNQLMTELEQGFEQDNDRSWISRALILTFGTRSAATREVGLILRTLLIPAISNASLAEERALTRRELLLLTAAIAEFRQQAGNYPERLDELVPDYFDAVPLDRFTGKPFHYISTDATFKLYSYGPNQEDDDGRGWSHRDEKYPEADDICIGDISLD